MENLFELLGHSKLPNQEELKGLKEIENNIIKGYGKVELFDIMSYCFYYGKMKGKQEDRARRKH